MGTAVNTALATRYPFGKRPHVVAVPQKRAKNLTRKQIRELKAKLNEDLAETRQELERYTDQLKNHKVEGAFSIHNTAGSDQEELENTSLFKNRAELKVQTLNASLARIENGAYGVCVSCYKPIGIDRMRAEPNAVKCCACR